MELFAPLIRIHHMGRQLRRHFEGIVLHVTARGNGGQPIFDEDADYDRFLHWLGLQTQRCGAELLAYCLMTNHVHLLLMLLRDPIWNLMQPLLTSHARYMNRKRDAKGNLFQHRYYDVACDKDRQLLATVRYLHKNPIEAGIVKSPEAYEYSSDRAYRFGESGLAKTDLILGMLAESQESAREEYRSFMLNPDADLDPILEQCGAAVPREIILSLFSIARSVSVSRGLPIWMIRSQIKTDAVCSARREFIIAARALAHTVEHVGSFLVIHPSAVSRIARRGR